MDMCLESKMNCTEAVTVRLKRDLAKGGMDYGARLLPLRKLAVQYSTSYPTMRKAVSCLCDEGVLSSRQGSGVYVAQENIHSNLPPRKNKKVLSMVFCGMEEHITTRCLYSKLLYGIEKEAAKQGFEVAISLLRRPDEFCGTEAYENADGFIILGNKNLNGLESIFKNKSVVWVMGSDKTWGDHITYNNKAIGFLSAEWFISKGYNHLAYINVDSVVGKERCLAFKEHAEMKGASVLCLDDPDALITNRFEQHIDLDTVNNWVDQLEKSKPRPKGVFVVDTVAYPLYNALIERGIKPGRDIEIATCNWRDAPVSGLKYQPLNIDICPEEIGMIAVRHLEWRLANPDLRRIVMKLEPDKQDRMS